MANIRNGDEIYDDSNRLIGMRDPDGRERYFEMFEMDRNQGVAVPYTPADVPAPYDSKLTRHAAEHAAMGINVQRYGGYQKERPLSHVVTPFGSAAINESILTGGAISRSVDSSEVFNGAPSSKLSITTGGSTPHIEVGTTGASITLDAEGQALLTRKPLVAIKVGAGNILSYATLYVGDATYASFYTFSLSVVARVGDWAILSKGSTGATTTTGTPNLAASVRSKLRITCTSNATVGDIWVSPVYVLPQPTPSVVFTCDDGYSEWEWLAGEAYKRGVPISFGISTGYVGTPSFLTEQQILSIANDYNGLHEITNHARINLNFATQGLDAYLSDVEGCRDYLVRLGLSRKAASLHQYVQGSYDQTLIDAMKARGYLSCRRVSSAGVGADNIAISMEGPTCNSLYEINATCNLENTQDLTTVKNYVTQAASVGSAFIMGHKFGATAATVQWIKGYDSSYGVLNLLDWLAYQRDTQGWLLRKWSDWYDDQINPKLPTLL